MKFNKVGSGVSAPSSTLGIMRFFDTDSGGPKMSPEFIVALAVVFTIAILFVKLIA